MSSQVSKTHAQDVSQHSGQAQRMTQVDEREVEAKANAQAGLNLNLAAAVSGIFTGWSKKKTDTKADGSSHSTTDSHGVGHVKGHGVGTLNAVGQGEATTTERQRRTIEGTQEQIKQLGTSDRKMVEAAQK